MGQLKDPLERSRGHFGLLEGSEPGSEGKFEASWGQFEDSELGLEVPRGLLWGPGSILGPFEGSEPGLEGHFEPSWDQFKTI